MVMRNYVDFDSREFLVGINVHCTAKEWTLNIVFTIGCYQALNGYGAANIVTANKHSHNHTKRAAHKYAYRAESACRTAKLLNGFFMFFYLIWRFSIWDSIGTPSQIFTQAQSNENIQYCVCL